MMLAQSIEDKIKRRLLAFLLCIYRSRPEFYIGFAPQFLPAGNQAQ